MKIKHTLYDYPNSPSGKIIIDKLVPPFMPVEGGHGFIGVTAVDSKTGQIQCHVCGEWHEQLGLHLWKRHEMLSDAYRAKFGLWKSSALQSERLREIRRKTMLKMRAEHPEKHTYKFPKGNWQAGNIRGKKHPAARANAAGVCELQIADRIKKTAERLGRTPGVTDLYEDYGGGFVGALKVRYGSHITLMKQLGYKPLTSAHNPKYSKKFFLNLGVERLMRCEDDRIKLTKLFDVNEYAGIRRHFGSAARFKKALERQLS